MQKHSKPLKMKPQKRVGSEEWSALNPRGAGGVGCGDSGTHAAWAAGTPLRRTDCPEATRRGCVGCRTCPAAHAWAAGLSLLPVGRRAFSAAHAWAAGLSLRATRPCKGEAGWQTVRGSYRCAAPCGCSRWLPGRCGGVCPRHARLTTAGQRGSCWPRSSGPRPPSIPLSMRKTNAPDCS